MKPKHFLLLLAVAAVLPAAAQQSDIDLTSFEAKPAFIPQHELRLSAGYFALPSSVDFHNYYHNGEHHIFGDSYEGGFTTRKSDRIVSGAWTLAYDYRFKKWLDAGAAITYYGEYSSLYSNFDNSLIERRNYTSIAVMPVVRFTWINLKWFRMYGSLGLGIMFDTGRQAHGRSLVTMSGQASVGITVGKALFGFAETGIGSQGLLIAGIGYRFNGKTK